MGTYAVRLQVKHTFSCHSLVISPCTLWFTMLISRRSWPRSTKRAVKTDNSDPNQAASALFINKHVCCSEEASSESHKEHWLSILPFLGLTRPIVANAACQPPRPTTTSVTSHEYQKLQTPHHKSEAEYVRTQPVLRWI
jgi:hypothetical protein